MWVTNNGEGGRGGGGLAPSANYEFSVALVLTTTGFLIIISKKCNVFIFSDIVQNF